MYITRTFVQTVVTVNILGENYAYRYNSRIENKLKLYANVIRSFKDSTAVKISMDDIEIIKVEYFESKYRMKAEDFIKNAEEIK